jgi:hypothetical protein
MCPFVINLSKRDYVKKQFTMGHCKSSEHSFSFPCSGARISHFFKELGYFSWQMTLETKILVLVEPRGIL